MPLPNHMMTNPVDADPLRIESTAASPLGLVVRLSGVGDRVRHAVNDQQSGADRNQVAIAVLPPRRKRYHCPDTAARGQMRGDPAAHGVPDNGDAVRFAAALNVFQNPFGVVHRILARAIPAAQAVSHLPYSHGGS